MPRYFFNLRDGEDLPDETGVELANEQEARIQAVVLAGGLLKDHPDGAFWDGHSWRVEVTDESQTLLFALNFSATVPVKRVA